MSTTFILIIYWLKIVLVNKNKNYHSVTFNCSQNYYQNTEYGFQQKIYDRNEDKKGILWTGYF